MPRRRRPASMPRVNRRLARMAALATVILAAVGFGLACGDDDGETSAVAAQCAETEFGGDGEPDALIASDLPMRGESRERSEQMVEAIRIVLERNQWRAGEITVGLRVCDDSSAETGLWDAAQCRANARADAEDASVLAVIGTYNSGCAAEMIPILNRAPSGPLAMVSPGNTLICLTESADTCSEGQPESLYPTGERNYARVIPNDAFQGAALAQLASEETEGGAFVLYAGGDPTSFGQASTFRNAAAELGVEVVGFETWDPDAGGYRDLMGAVKRSGAGALVLAGLTEQNAGRVIRDKVEALGPNDGDVALIGFDGLTQQSTIGAANGAAEGMLASLPGKTPETLRGEGGELVSELERRVGPAPVELFAPYAGEAAELVLEAIAAAGGDRAAVTRAILSAEREMGILGSYEITDNGDPTVGPVSIFVARDSFEAEREITPNRKLVAAARGR
jgi:branched-chain amino acid transport system substrate-binding protein